ncbi:MAG: hypothetical protein AAF490_19055 [Chloroflexota bacterium]
MNYEFEPIDGLWRFHFIYLILMVMLGLSFFPEKLYLSFFVIAGGTLIGLGASRLKWHLLSHVFAVVVGLLSPVIFFASLLWWHTLIAFVAMAILGFILREFLF